MPAVPRILRVLVLAGALTGCATTAPPAPDAATAPSAPTTAPAPEPAPAVTPVERWAAQQAVNGSLAAWSLQGKISVRAGERGGGAATLRWSYAGAEQQIELYGPLGSGRVRVDASAGAAVLQDSKGRVITGDSPEQVIAERLGWQIPFSELVLWSRGLPSAGATEVRTDEHGRLVSLHQGAWRVEYQDYRQVERYVLPGRLLITSVPGALELYDRNGRYLGDTLEVKVLLKRWWGMVTG